MAPCRQRLCPGCDKPPGQLETHPGRDHRHGEEGQPPRHQHAANALGVLDSVVRIGHAGADCGAAAAHARQVGQGRVEAQPRLSGTGSSRAYYQAGLHAEQAARIFAGLDEPP